MAKKRSRAASPYQFMDPFPSDPRFLFLTSLRHERDPYWRRVASIGSGLLNSSLSTITGSNTIDTSEKFNMALNVLSDGIQQEQVAEQAYIRNLLNKANSIQNPKIKKYLTDGIKSFFPQNGGVDYLKLIDFINQILTGANMYKQILQIESQRIDQLNKDYENLKNDIDQDPRELLVETRKKNDKGEHEVFKKLYDDGEQYIREIYLDRHRMRNEDSKYFQDVNSTIDNLMASVANRVIQECISKGRITTLQEADQFLKGKLISSIHNAMQSKNLQLLALKTEEARENAIIKEMQSDIDNYFQNITTQLINNPNSTDVKNIQKKRVGYKTNDKSQIEISGIEVAKRIESLIDKVEKLLDPQHSTSLTDSENIFVKIMTTEIYSKNKTTGVDLLKNLKEAKKDFSNNPTNTENRKALSVARGNFGRYFNKSVKQYIQNNVLEAPVINAIDDVLNGLAIEISGSDLSELIGAYFQEQQDLDSLRQGQRNKRADVITVQMSWPRYSTKNSESYQETNAKNLATYFINDYQTLLSKKAIINGKEIGASDYSPIKGRKAFLVASKNMRALAQEYYDQLKEEGFEPALELADYIKNTVMITETMKTFNTYNNNLGFVNGSMGGTLAKQVENFAELFEAAGVGMSQTEQEQLIFALVNCSSAALGASNLTPLERYLSTLAGFAIFDEGLVELEKMNSQTAKYYQGTPQIMHLYRLNGIYFPGSFILKRIYQQLTQTVQSTESIFSGNDGAKINARAGAGIISKLETMEPSWNETYQSALAATSVEITFVSQLLNIINSLTQAFSVK